MNLQLAVAADDKDIASTDVHIYLHHKDASWLTLVVWSVVAVAASTAFAAAAAAAAAIELSAMVA